MATQRAVVLFENDADTATLSGGSYRSTLPRTNMQTADIRTVARTTDAANASTMVKVDLGAIKQIDGVALGPINASPGATYRVRSYSDSSFSTLKYDSGTRTLPGTVVTSTDLEWEDSGFWYGLNTETLLPELPVFLIEIIPAASLTLAQQQFWKIEIFDSANASGYLDIGRLFMGRAFRPAINYDEDNGFGLSALTDMVESLGGKRTYFERGIRRTLRLSFKYLTETEAFGDAFRMAVKARDSRQIFIVPDYGDTTYLQERSFLATFKTIPSIQQLLVSRGATAIDAEEVL